MFGGPVLTYFFLKYKVHIESFANSFHTLLCCDPRFKRFNSSHAILIVIRFVTGVLCAGCLSLSLAISMAMVPNHNKFEQQPLLLAAL